MPAPAISLGAVSFGYDGKRIIDAVSFDVAPGEFLAIIGPNGCGKSTTLKLMAGLHRTDGGKILVSGRELGQFGRKALAREIALLTQIGTPPGGITVYELIAMGRFAHQSLLSRRSREDEAMIADAMFAMHVQALQDRRVGSLSGGQLQRCRMAMVLAQASRTLLLDEPTTYLDLKYQYGILDCARQQARQGKAVVAVLHDFTQASLYADRIAVMHEGRLVSIGSPADVLTEDMIAEVFGLRTRAASAHGAIFHVPEAVIG